MGSNFPAKNDLGRVRKFARSPEDEHGLHCRFSATTIERSESIGVYLGTLHQLTSTDAKNCFYLTMYEYSHCFYTIGDVQLHTD